MIKRVEVSINVILENGETRKLVANRNLDFYKDQPSAQAYSLDGLIDSVHKSLFIQWAELFTAEEAKERIEALAGNHKLFEAYLKNIVDGKTNYIYEKN